MERISTLIKQNSLIWASILLSLVGCSQRSELHEQDSSAHISDPLDSAVAPDIAAGWQWSHERLATLNKRAQNGDMKAGRDLLHYYTVHEDISNIEKWQNWLLQLGDAGAIEYRVHILHSTAMKRGNNDPRKLAELKEAEQLWNSVNPSPVDNPFLQKIRLEIASIEGSKLTEK